MTKLILENVEKSFDEKKVLKGASFTFETGKIYGLIGRNGAGKTTLFNCINEDMDKDGGTIEVEEDNEKRPLQADDIGYVLSSPTVPEFLTGREFLKFFAEANPQADHTKSIDAYFDMMSIQEEDRDRLIKNYSFGMNNKMQMLTALMADPEILLLDEPLTSFDVVVAEEMKQLLRKVKTEHIIIFGSSSISVGI
ncbi:MAG: ABC transporter ATP-binding protein [Erysipelotrichaceae bacterium]|nr:ABC transporter ATP-binding protein [Erysipelotrichaceae bacterium]